MEEFNIKDFWDYYKGYILIVVLVCIFGVASVLLYDKFMKKPLMLMTRTKMELSTLLNTTNSSKISSREWEENAIILLILLCNGKELTRIRMEKLAKKNSKKNSLNE